MKNKKNIYFLVPAVLLIWGIIGYKIYTTLNVENAVLMPNNSSVDFNPEKIKEVEKFTINANYRDPFLGKLITNKKVSSTPVKIKQKPTVIFPMINYNGMISPKEANRATLFLIVINNKQQFLSVGEEIEGVKLLKGNSKEIIISFQNSKKTIHIQQ